MGTRSASAADLYPLLWQISRVSASRDMLPQKVINKLFKLNLSCFMPKKNPFKNRPHGCTAGLTGLPTLLAYYIPHFLLPFWNLNGGSLVVLLWIWRSQLSSIRLYLGQKHNFWFSVRFLAVTCCCYAITCPAWNLTPAEGQTGRGTAPTCLPVSFFYFLSRAAWSH